MPPAACLRSPRPESSPGEAQRSESRHSCAAAQERAKTSLHQRLGPRERARVHRNHPRRRRTDTARSGERSAFEETLHGDRSGATPLVPPRLGHPRAGGRLPEPSERSPESRAGSRWIMLGCSRGFGGRRWGAAPTPTLSEPVLRNPVGVDDWFGHEDTTPSGLDGHRCPGSPAKRGALGATAVPPASTRRGPGESRCTARVAASITAVMWSPAEERGKRSEKWGVGRAPMLPMPGIRDWEPVGEPAGMVCAGMPATAKR